ncbi:MAG: zinc ribbon domain-containing protein [Clostridia bacterium]|nr:zinc ribbon domain-containing protein [Clostridia bacterium]
MNNSPKSKKYILLDSFGMGPYAMKRIKICPRCGNINGKKTLICPVCKKLLSIKTLFDYYKAMHTCCGFCGEPLSKDALYCPSCGRKTDYDQGEKNNYIKEN